MSNFSQISQGAFCRNGIDNLFEWFRAIEQDGRYMVKALKNLNIKHQGLYQVCSNDGRGLTFDFFTARSNLRPHTFVWGNVEKSFSRYTSILKTIG